MKLPQHCSEAFSKLLRYVSLLATFLFVLCGCAASDNHGKSWHELESVGEAPGGLDKDWYNFLVANPSLTKYENGKLGVSWIQELEDGSSGIFGNQFSKETGWQSPVEIQNGHHTIRHNELFKVGRGNVIAMWLMFNGSTNEMNTWADVYRPGKGWTGPAAVNREFGGIFSPQVIPDSSGGFFMVWQENSVRYKRVWAIHYSEASGWSTGEPLDTNEANSENVTSTVSSNGMAVVMWEQQLTDDTIEVLANWYSPATGWHGMKVIGSSKSLSSSNIAIDDQGNAIAVWQSFNEKTMSAEVWHADFRSEGVWTTSQRLSTAGNTAANPVVAMSGSGNALIAWHELDESSDTQQLVASRKQSGYGWSPPLIITKNLGDGYVENLIVQIDDQSEALALWMEIPKLQTSWAVNSIVSSRYVPWQKWGAPKVLATEVFSDGGPAMEMDANGNAIAIWTMFKDGRFGIWSRRYE